MAGAARARICYHELGARGSLKALLLCGTISIYCRGKENLGASHHGAL